MSLGIQAQVFNNAYNNSNHVFHRQVTDEYVFCYDSFYDLLFDDFSNSYYIFAGSTPASSFLGSGDTVLGYFLRVDSMGNASQTKELTLDTNDLISLASPYLLNNGCSVSFGYTKKEYPNSKSEGLMLVLDSSFEMLNYFSYGFGESTVTTEAKSVNHGQSFFTISNVDIDSTSNAQYDIFLAEMDTSGNIIDTMQFGGNDYDLGFNLILLANGNFLISGYTWSYGAGDEDIYLFEADSLGNVVWQKTFGYPGTDISGSQSLLNDELGNIYICGWTELNTGNRAAWLIKTDRFGNMLWEKKFDRGSFFDGFVGMDFSYDGQLIIVGSTHNYELDSINAPPIGWLLKVDTNGIQIWSRLVSKYAQLNSNDYISSLLVDNNGEIIVAGYVIASDIYTADTLHVNDGWLCKLDSCGYTVGAAPTSQFIIDSIVDYTVYISNSSQDYCSAFLDLGNGDSIPIYAYSEFTSGVNPTQVQYTYTDTGNYELALYSYAGDAIDTFMLSLALQDTSTGLVPLVEEYALRIFPNPSQDFFVLELAQLNQAQQINELQIEIVSINGQTVFSSNLNPALFQQKVNTSTLRNGVYLIKVSINQQYVLMNKWVKMDY